MHLWSWAQQHRGLAIAAMAVVVVGCGAVAGWYLIFRTVSSPVSVRGALGIYRHDRSGGPGTLRSGVFSYATSGGESLNLVGVSRTFPSRSSMVVTSGQSGSCSAVDWVPLTQHSETTTVCRSSSHALAITKLVDAVTLAGTADVTVISCPATAYLLPPIDVPGVQWHAACHQVSPAEPVAMTGQVVGVVPISVGGTSVPSVQVSLNFRFEGPDSGTSPVTFWVSPSRGLVVRELETATIEQGSVRYREVMDARLSSLVPAGSGR